MKNWKSPFDNHLYLFSKPLKVLYLLLFLSHIAIAQVEDSKTIKDDYNGKKAVSLLHSHGPTLIKKSPDNKVHIEASISAKAKDRENLDILLKHFEIQSGGLGERLDLSTIFQIESCNTVNNNSTIKFKDGSKAKGIKDFIISVTLLIPDLNELKLNNKYGDISIETEVSGDLSVVLFSGKLETSGLCNNLDLSMKYSKGFLQNAGDAKMELFDSDLKMGDLFSANINSKYSEVEMNNVGGNLTIQTFDDKWKVGHVKGQFNFNDKYSEFEFQSLGEAEGSIFDGEIKAASIGNLLLKESKYSKYIIGKINDFRSTISFDDKIEIKMANTVSSRDSKYSDYAIGHLSHSFSLGSSFDDNIHLERVSADFQGISLNGKYTKMEFRIDDGAQFHVEVDMQYGKFDHPDFDIRIHKELNNKLELNGYFGGEDETPESRLSIKGFDNTIYWR